MGFISLWELVQRTGIAILTKDEWFNIYFSIENIKWGQLWTNLTPHWGISLALDTYDIWLMSKNT